MIRIAGRGLASAATGRASGHRGAVSSSASWAADGQIASPLELLSWLGLAAPLAV
jgi:hypothetical protein